MQMFYENITIADLTHQLLNPNVQSNDIAIETSNNNQIIYYKKVSTLPKLINITSLPICQNSKFTKIGCTSKNSYEIFPFTESLAPISLNEKQFSVNDRLCECFNLAKNAKMDIFGIDDKGKCLAISKRVENGNLKKFYVDDCLDVDLKECTSQRFCIGNINSFFLYEINP